jgi:methylmalonyl-CoA mutase cobalamin-binding domain/chain
MTRMFENDVVKRSETDREEWQQTELADFLERQPESAETYLSDSRLPLKRVYTPADVAELDWEAVGLPGREPFTRGPYPTMYRGRVWTMRQIAGFGTGADTNRRFRYLIEQGQTGLSVDFDMPTLMGFDSDDEMSVGEVGREGVAIDVLDDMRDLFDGIDLEKISVSMTINPSAFILLAMYVAVAEERSNDLNKLSGTIQNDILKEYMAQKEWIYPIRPSIRIVRDTVVYCSKHMRRYNPINISGYHINEAGSSSVQEIAFTMASAKCYLEEVTRAGVDIDEFASRLSFFFVSGSDFFEEVAKFRAARRVWSKITRQLGAKLPESGRLRFHCQTAAATLTKPQPFNNIVRTAFQAMSAVLGGAQSLHTNGLDEAYAIPSEFAMKLSLRTQQILAEETGVTQVIDPLGGSWYVEALTDQVEMGIWDYLEKVDALGGTVRAIEQGFFQREIADFAYDEAQRRATGERPVVGVNSHVDPAGEVQQIEIHRNDPETEKRQVDHLQRVKTERDNQKVRTLLAKMQEQARDEGANLMPITIEAVKANASMGEIVETLREVWGSYRETPVF